MSHAYKLAEQGGVIRTDGAHIPNVPGNRDWQEYQGWLAAGNTPEPVDVIDHTAANIAQLWQAAHDYEYAQISGSAIGLLAKSVIGGKTKALAVDAWIRSIWTLYYERKATVGGGEPIDTSLLDFSGCGPMPHTVPELITEDAL